MKRVRRKNAKLPPLPQSNPTPGPSRSLIESYFPPTKPPLLLPPLQLSHRTSLDKRIEVMLEAGMFPDFGPVCTLPLPPSLSCPLFYPGEVIEAPSVSSPPLCLSPHDLDPANVVRQVAEPFVPKKRVKFKIVGL